MVGIDPIDISQRALIVELSMNQMIENLIGLQALEVSDEESPSGLARIKEMRQRIPVPVLLHYDRLRVRGKKGGGPRSKWSL